MLSAVFSSVYDMTLIWGGDVMWALAGKGTQEDMTPSFKLQRRIMAFEKGLLASAN